MAETLEFGPQPSSRILALARGFLVGAGIGFGSALVYLWLIVGIGTTAQVLYNLTGHSVYSYPIENFAIVASFVVIGGVVVGVLPATVAGGLAGAAIGLQQSLFGRRQGHMAAAVTGMLICCMVAASAVGLFALAIPEGVTVETNAPSVWLPVAIFVLAGAPFTWLIRKFACIGKPPRLRDGQAYHAVWRPRLPSGHWCSAARISTSIGCAASRGGRPSPSLHPDPPRRARSR